MSTEIERKWHVPAAPGGLPPGSTLRQGYLSTATEGEVRLRDKAGRLRLTVKQGRGLTRAEVEVDVTPAQFEALWPLTAHARIEKTRHVLTHAAHAIEVDVFTGALAGLCVAEVEFASEADAAAFAPPAWFGVELTGRDGWSNADLAVHGLPADAP
jgi:adenylate cyclase